jgi:transposase
MQTAATIGLDIAKNVFQVHGITPEGRIVFRQQLKRGRVLAFFKKLKPCLVGIEACATSHHWAREISAPGHTVKLMPPAHVKACVKRQKNDAADAEAICEAVQRPTMRFVPIKSPDEQAGMVLHRTRHLFVRHLTAVVNATRAHMAEFGIVAAKGREGVAELVAVIKDLRDDRLPTLARTCLYALAIQLEALSQQIAILDKRLTGWSRTNETCRRLDAMPGVGPALATALVASVADPKAFKSGRDFSAWVGLVPKQRPSGGKEKLGSITKAGDR